MLWSPNCNGRPKVSNRACTMAAVALLPALLVSPAGAQFTVIARTGVAPPAGGGTYSSLGIGPTINTSGQVAFTSNISSGTATRGMFTGTAGSLQAVALQGTAAPAGGNFNNIDVPVLNASGTMLFNATLTGTSTQGFFIGTAGSLQTVALVGNPAPAGGNYSSLLAGPLLNASGRVAFRADVTTASRGIFAGSPASLQTVALIGDTVPGGGSTYATFPQNPVLNGAGTVAFNATLSGGSTAGIFAGAATASLQTVALAGGTAPGGGTYATFVNPTINSAGQVAFGATMSSGSGIFAGAVGAVQAVAREGNAAPAGGNFGAFSISPVINSSGRVAFVSNLTSVANGIFTGTAGSLQKVAIAGEATPAGGTFSSLGFPLINSAGELTFTASLSGAGVTASNDAALFGYKSGTLFAILREGDVIDIDPTAGVLSRTVSSFGLTSSGAGGEDGRTVGLNDSGVVAYRVSFVEGDTAILTSPVPEPSSLGALGAAGVALLRRRARRPASGDSAKTS